MNKFVLKSVAAAAVAVLGGNAFAAVTISATPVVPVLFAQELTPTGATPIALTNAANVLDLVTTLNYTMSGGEVRTVRLDLSGGAIFAANSTVAISNTGTAGAINGLGTSVITFSITAPAGGLVSGTTITISGDRSIVNTAATVTANYGLYDQPSQGIAGGTNGRITNIANANYITFARSYTVVAVTGSAVADVSAPIAFSKFIAQGANTPNSATTALLGSLDYRLATVVPLKANGTAITLADLMATGATGTKLVIDGDFTAASDVATPSYTTATALARVFLSTANTCPAVTVPASTLSATTATFNVGATPTTPNIFLCYTPNGTTPIPKFDYTYTLKAISATPATYTVADIGPSPISSITRNGTELQAPLFQITPGYIPRFSLTNTGATTANYTISVRGEAGATLATGTLTGTIPAGAMKVIDGSSILTSVTGGVGNGAPRAFVVFTVDRPTAEIQGVYQIVNPSSGAVSNQVLVRPGTN